MSQGVNFHKILHDLIARGWTQTDIATRLGLSQAAISYALKAEAWEPSHSCGVLLIDWHSSGARKPQDGHKIAARRSRKYGAGHYVYAIRCRNNIKIGYSINPRRRCKEIQAMNADEVTIAAAYECPSRAAALRLEKQIQAAALDYLIGGEWFKFKALHIFGEFEPGRRNAA